MRGAKLNIMNADQLPAEAKCKVASNEPTQAALTNPERWVEEYGDELFGFAMTRVRDRGAAQDLVQETFLAALRAGASFAGRSTERAWLFGILRNKVVDYYRVKAREAVLAPYDSTAPEEDNLFHATGPRKDVWIKSLAPQPWTAPDESLVRKEFHAVLHQCLARLPRKVAQVFFSREVDGLSSEQICKEQEISPNNLWVISHRARLALRRCLELHWFGRKNMNDEKD